MINKNKLNELLADSASHVKINKYELDLEFTKQPCLYHRYSNMQADLETEKNTLRAELDKEIRREFIKDTKKTPSEAYVKAAIEGNKDYITLLFFVNRIEGILKTLEQKKRCLEKLADLSMAGYFATPRCSKE